MKRVCNNCGNTGIFSVTLQSGLERSVPCAYCSAVPVPDVNGIGVVSRSDIHDTPRYTLRRNMTLDPDTQGDRWVDVQHNGNRVAIATKVEELRAKGTANWQLQVIDNWS